MKKILPLSTFLLLSIIFIACSDYEESIVNTGISEKKATIVDTTAYSIQGFNSSISLGLLSNNTFYYRTSFFSCFGGGDIKHISGNYIKENTKIILQPTQVKTTSYEDFYILEEDEEDYYENSPRIKTYPYSEEEFKIKNEYYIININNKSYALSEGKKDNFFSEKSPYNDFERLASLLKKEDKVLGSILSRQTNDTTLFTIKQIPTKWRFLFK